MVALRGTPDDYDEWERLGAAGWGWDGVLPYFRKLETDLDFGGELHGNDGPTPVRRVTREDWTPVARAAHAFAQERQMPLVADMNGDFRDGYCALPMSNTTRTPCVGGDLLSRRGGARAAEPDDRDRARTFRSCCSTGRARAASSQPSTAQQREFRAREIILCAGAIQTPAMLMRAGIGPADHLRALGIDVRADLPGVGRNLQNHPVLFIGAHLRPAARQQPSLRTLAGLVLPALVRHARLSADRPVHPSAEQIVVECARRADRQLRPGAVEAVLARPRVAERRADHSAGRIQLRLRRPRPAHASSSASAGPPSCSPPRRCARCTGSRSRCASPIGCAGSTRKRAPTPGKRRLWRACSISVRARATTACAC